MEYDCDGWQRKKYENVIKINLILNQIKNHEKCMNNFMGKKTTRKKYVKIECGLVIRSGRNHGF